MNLTKIVHIDLKGGAIKLSYLKNIINLIKKFSCDGLLIEYEDMFPFSKNLSVLARKDAYDIDELKDFIRFCNDEKILVIPLVQTFGHMEYVLKHEEYRYLRENFKHPMTICPTLTNSMDIIKDMINQILEVHHDTKYLHIGCDEVFDFKICQICKVREVDKSMIFLEHVKNVASYVKSKKNIQPLMWDDMLRHVDVEEISAAKLSEVVEVMIWNYLPTLNIEDSYFHNMIKLFPRLWGASAFKGANGPIQQLVNTSVYVKNNQSWTAKIVEMNNFKHGQFIGIVLTGWSRFDHFAGLCEILPASIPCLVLCLEIARTGSFTAEIHEKISKDLGYSELIPWEPMFHLIDPGCQLNFPGYEIYQGVSGWHILQTEATNLINSDYMKGWLSKYHRKKLIGNGATVQVIVQQLDSLLFRYNKWKTIFQPLFQEVLMEEQVEEWIEVHVTLMMEKLKKISRQGCQIIALGDSVFERSTEAAGDS